MTEKERRPAANLTSRVLVGGGLVNLEAFISSNPLIPREVDELRSAKPGECVYVTGSESRQQSAWDCCVNPPIVDLSRIPKNRRHEIEEKAEVQAISHHLSFSVGNTSGPLDPRGMFWLPMTKYYDCASCGSSSTARSYGWGHRRPDGSTLCRPCLMND